MKRFSGSPPSSGDSDEKRVLQIVARAYPSQDDVHDHLLVKRAVAQVSATLRPQAAGARKWRLSFALILLGAFAGGAVAAVAFPALWKAPEATRVEPAPVHPKAAPEALPAPAPAPAPAVVAPARPAATPKARVQPPAAAPQSPPDAAPDNGAARLFEEARRARALGWEALAAKQFEQLINQFPTSPEADVSRLAAGRLYRRLGDHARALAAFSSYLQHNPGGPLEEEAMAGVAQSLQAQGQDARAAWQALADAHPQSPYLKAHAAKP